MFKEIYLRIFPDSYLKELEKSLSDAKSVLDLGCGNSSPIRNLKKGFYSAGIDDFKPSIEESKKKKIHDKYYKMDVLDTGDKFGKDSFDVVLALDLIEHLTKEEGNKLLKIMERIARDKVIVFTPNGFLGQGKYRGNPLQKHKSGWKIKEFKTKGYKVLGIHGWKKLRGEFSKIKFKPKMFWRVISDITQKRVKKRPENAFQIFCIKELGNKR